MEHYIAIILVGIGTYLTRLLPIRFSETIRKINGINRFFSYSAAALISSLFISSLISSPVSVKNLGIGIAALIPVYLSYKKWKNLGIAVLIGIAAHLLISLIVNF